jgi:WD40 repeat protein/tRNA A-37 threonylcarbamoyl transferase component Bud32
MNSSMPTTPGDRPARSSERVDEACDRFETAWRAGQAPRIEDYLVQAEEADRPALLGELLALECELRRRRGERPELDEYLTRFPAHTVIAHTALGAATISDGTLATVDQPRSPHDQPTAVAAPGLGGAPAVATSDPASVRSFGDYEIVREVARGGMGVVFQARQVKLNRMVALKMILAGQLAGESEIRRFYTEAEAAAHLDHPGIVPIFEVGEHEGRHYFSMGFVEGESLAQRLATGPLGARTAAELLAKVAEAIAYAHRRGVIHRDLKPANILIDGAGQPRVTDFGLAKKVQADSHLTASGQIMGTPSYMPPEQTGGNRGEVGPPADVYALGATLYCAMTGRPPFQAATAMDTVLQVISDDPVPPRRLNPAIDRDVETICLKCLEKDPARRYASAEELGEDLRRYLAGASIRARPVGQAERLVRWCRRNGLVAASLAAVAMAMVIGTVVATVFGLRAAASARQARTALKEAEAARVEEGRQRAAAQAALKEAEAARVGEGRQRAAAQDLEKSRRRELVAVLVANGTRALRAGDPGSALPWLAEAARLDPDPVHRGRLDGVLGLMPRPSFLWRHAQSVTHIAVSPDNLRAATASLDGKARLWDLRTGRAIGDPLAHDSAVMALAFSPDGRVAATAGGAMLAAGEVRLWDAGTGRALGEPIRTSHQVLFIGFTADGSRLVTCEMAVTTAQILQNGAPSFRWIYRMFDRHNRQELRQTPGQETASALRGEALVRSIEPLVHSGTGRILIVSDRTAKVVDLADGRTLGAPITHDSPIWFARLVDEGRKAITHGSNAKVQVRDVASGKNAEFSTNYPILANDAAFDARGSLCLSFYDGAVRRYDAETGRVVEAPQERMGGVGWVPQFVRGANVLLAGWGDGSVRVWEVQGQRPLSPGIWSGASPTALALADEGRRVLIGCDDGTVRVWDLAFAPQPKYWIQGPFFHKVEFDAQGRCLVLGQGTAYRFDPATRRKLMQADPKPTPSARAIELSPDGSRLAVGNDRGEVRLIDVDTLAPVGSPGTHGRKYVLDAVFSRDGRRLATRGTDGEDEARRFLGDVQVWDVATGRRITATPLKLGGLLEYGGIIGMDLDASGDRLAAGGAVFTLRGVSSRLGVFDAATGRPSGRRPAPSPGMFFVTAIFHPDGRRLAVLSRSVVGPSGELAVWDVTRGEYAILPTHLGGQPSSWEFDPEGRRLAVTSDRLVRVWDMATHRLAYSVPHSANVTMARFQAGGRILLSFADRDVGLWDAATGEPLRPFIVQPSRVQSAAVSPDGCTLAVAVDWSQDRRVFIWDLVSDPDSAKLQPRLARLLGGRTIEGSVEAAVPTDQLVEDWERLRDEAPALLAPNDAAIREWHDRQASRLVGLSEWSEAGRHLGELAARQPEPEGRWTRYLLCACWTAAREREALRAAAIDLLARTTGSTNLQDVERAVKAGLILPDLLPDPRVAIRLSDALEKADPKEWTFSWLALARGLALYRDGRLVEADDWLGRCRSVKDPPVACAALADFVLAMVQAGRGRTGEARALLAGADGRLAAIEKQPWTVGWNDRIHVQVLAEEARKVIPAR